MKKLFLICILLFIGFFLVAQTKRDSDLVSPVLNKNDAYNFYLKGDAYLRTSTLDSAEYFFLKSFQYYQSINSSIHLAPLNVNLGIIQYHYGNYEKAMKYYNKAEELYKNLDDKNQLTYVYINKANIFEIQKDYKKAEQFYLNALIILNQNKGSKLTIASVYNNLGIVYRNTGNNEKAIEYFLESLKLKDVHERLFTPFGNIALSYDQLNRIDEAEIYYLKALENIEQTVGNKNRWYALNQTNYGTFLINKKNDSVKSLEYLENALSIYKTIYGNKSTDLAFSYNRIGDYYLKIKDYKSALLNFQKSLVALSADFNDTTEYSNPEPKQVLSKAHLLRALKNKIIALNFLGDSEPNNLEFLQKSKQTSDLAIDVIREIRSGFLSEQSKLFLAENEQDIYQLAIGTCYKLYSLTGNNHYIKEAFRFAESGKSAVLSEAIQNNTALIQGNVPPDLLDQLNSIDRKSWITEELLYEEKRKSNPDKAKIDKWNQELFELGEKKSVQIDNVEKEYPEYFKLKNNQSFTDIKQIQKHLSRHDVLIEYCLQKESLYTFVISNTNYQLYHQQIDSSFYNSIDTLIKHFNDNNFSKHNNTIFESFKRTSFSLYQRLIAPIVSEIKGKQLIVIPDGCFAYIPFETLISENKLYKTIKYNRLPYLLLDYAISYSYSANLLFDNNRDRNRAEHKLIAFAPDYKVTGVQINPFSETRQQYREKLYPLKGIKEEAKNVSELLHGNVFLDQDASELNFKKLAGNYDILHLAMHTILNDNDPMFSKMVFSQSEDTLEDGFLNTYEVYNLQLNSRMAVLSSCNTGSGFLNKGEGVMSLARGFIYAGCPSIIMTLWTVEDKSGTQLMTRFYKNLKLGRNKAKAARLAKIDFLNNADPLKSHPYYWSGYVVIGNKEPLFHPQYYLLILVFILICLPVYILFWKKRHKR